MSVQVNRQRSFGHMAITSVRHCHSLFQQVPKNSPFSTVRRSVYCLLFLCSTSQMQSYFGKLRHYLFCCYDSIQSDNFACGIAISAKALPSVLITLPSEATSTWCDPWCELVVLQPLPYCLHDYICCANVHRHEEH